MSVYTDLLPKTKSDPKGQTAIEWAQSTDEFCQIAGTLTIKSKRCYVSYLVEEFATGWDGRGFHLVKLNEGSDKTEEAYSCFLARDGQNKSCECKGFQATGGCKHLAALLALIQAGKL